MVACFHILESFAVMLQLQYAQRHCLLSLYMLLLALISTFLQLEEPAIKKLSTLCSRVKAAQLILVFCAFSDFDCEVQLLQGL